MDAAAQVGERAVLQGVDGLTVRDPVDDLLLERLVREGSLRLQPTDLGAHEGHVLANALAHERLDLLEVLRREGA